MAFYTVKMTQDGRRLGDKGLSTDSRVAAIRIANEWAALEGWKPDSWVVYRNADTTNAATYRRVAGRYRVT